MLLVTWLLACGSGSANPVVSARPVERVPFEGVVVERVDVGSYSYLRLDEGLPEDQDPAGRWVVGLDKGTQVGERVRVVPIGVVDTFASARAGRTFAPLWFGVLSPG